MRRRADNGHSVYNEPHLRDAETGKDNKTAAAPGDSVSGEPWHPAPKEGGQTRYAAWLAERTAATGPVQSWAVVLACALVAGPFAILGALWGTGNTSFSFLALTAFGPAVEELAKIMAVLMLVERFPYLVRSRAQIVVCAAAGGLAFAAIENLLYLRVYFPDAGPALFAWRWTICVALHTGCSSVAGLGVVRIWKAAQRLARPPRVEDGVRFFVAAILLHGAYNGFALVYESLRSPF